MECVFKSSLLRQIESKLEGKSSVTRQTTYKLHINIQAPIRPLERSLIVVS